MPMIGLIDFEDKIQVGDKTRLSAAKSFATPDVAVLEDVLIRPGADSSFISVWNVDAKKRFLDWAWASQTFDIDSINNQIYFNVDGTDYTATISSGTYTFANLKTAISTAMNTELAGTYSVLSDSKQRLSISRTGSKIKIYTSLEPANLMQDLGFNEDTELLPIVKGEPVEYGLKAVTVRLDNGSTSDFTFYQKVLTKESDYLFSSDQDLLYYEYDIINYVPQGRSSFLNVHRKAQSLILDWLDQQGYVDSSRNKFTKWAFIDVSDVKLWATYLALELIFRDFGNAKDDVFKEKAERYEKMVIVARNRTVLRLDVNADDKIDTDSSPDTWSGTLVSR